MKRILLAICLGLVSGLAFAGSAANAYEAQPSCPKAAAKAPVIARGSENVGTTQAPPAAVRQRGGGGTSTRLVSPRWHSLLPGMMR
jgi:hypothetical protein